MKEEEIEEIYDEENEEAEEEDSGYITLIITRGLVIIVVVWAITYTCFVSSANLKKSKVIQRNNALTLKTKELERQLKFAEDLGVSEELIEARCKWMLFIARMNVPDKECLKQADQLVVNLKEDTTLSLPEKIPYYEKAIVLYRSMEEQQKAVPIYKSLKKQIEESDLKAPQKKLLLARIENDISVTDYFIGLSTHAPSLSTLNKRMKKFETAKTNLEKTESDLEKIEPDKGDNAHNEIANLSQVLKKNKDEINNQIKFLKLRKRVYEESLN